ncbi:hypothetical protein WDZ17_10125 [Pseudokineococcus basanitobsidens]|uniref:Uncharacterized protein n=1 Tax=Pseudokineococcus basanitobsidens TaxID=1926649 RepID=A0ABU8RL19_9ACTN
MALDPAHTVVALLVPVLALAVTALVLYAVVRLAVRHGTLDARRRWRGETGGAPTPPQG